MFQAKNALFLYTLTPTHMGAGSALGLVDSPIQREVHNQWPVFAGSGIKGALRHAFGNADDWVGDVFGPLGEANDHYAGALSLADAQVVAFPVRCLRQAYVYATCPGALARTRRQLAMAGLDTTFWPEIPGLEDDAALVSNSALLEGEHLVLEALAMQATGGSDAVATIAGWLADHALPGDPAFNFFREKLRKDMVVLSDTTFTHFARHSTLVEPHVRINDDTGTADGGGLFYVENLPPETLMLSTVMTTTVRSGRTRTPADEVLAEFKARLSTLNPMQIGGDATIGRGLVALKTMGDA